MLTRTPNPHTDYGSYDIDGREAVRAGRQQHGIGTFAASLIGQVAGVQLAREIRAAALCDPVVVTKRILYEPVVLEESECVLDCRPRGRPMVNNLTQVPFNNGWIDWQFVAGESLQHRFLGRFTRRHILIREITGHADIINQLGDGYISNNSSIFDFGKLLSGRHSQPTGNDCSQGLWVHTQESTRTPKGPSGGRPEPAMEPNDRKPRYGAKHRNADDRVTTDGFDARAVLERRDAPTPTVREAARPPVEGSA